MENSVFERLAGRDKTRFADEDFASYKSLQGSPINLDVEKGCRINCGSPFPDIWMDEIG